MLVGHSATVVVLIGRDPSQIVIQVIRMNSKSLFYLTLLILAISATPINTTEAKEGLLSDSHINATNATATPSIDAQVPSNNKPLLIKGPTLDNYNEPKDLKASQKQDQTVVLLPQTKSQGDALSAPSTNIQKIEPSPDQPLKTPIPHQITPNKTDNSIKTVDQQPQKESIGKYPTENNSKLPSTPEELKKREEKLKTQAIEEKIQRENLPKLKQNQIKVIAATKQAKPLSKEGVKEKEAVSNEQMAQKEEKSKQETAEPQDNIVEVILPHPDEENIEVQTAQAKDKPISKQSADKPIKSDNKTIQTPIKNNISKTQKAPTQQIKIISLEEETTESEQPTKQNQSDAEVIAPSKTQQDYTKKAVPKQDKEKKEQSKQPEKTPKIEEKLATKEGINNSSQKITPVGKQAQIVRQAKEKEVVIDRKQIKKQESSQEYQTKPQKQAVAGNQSKPVVKQTQQKTIKLIEAKQKQATKGQTLPLKTTQPQPKGETNHVTQKVQTIQTPQAKQYDKPPHPDGKNQSPIESSKKEQRQPDLKQLLQEVKLDLNEKAKLNVIKHLQNQIQQLQHQTKQTQEKAKEEVSIPLKPQKQTKQQHLKQQQPISLQIGEEQSSQQIMDTTTIVVIIVMTFIISIPIFREIKNKQNAPPQSSRKQTNDPASATEDANQRLDLQFTDLDNQTGCAIGQLIDQQQR